MANTTNEEKLIVALQNDLKTLSLETKKKHSTVKDACEEAITKIRGAQSSQNNMAYITTQALSPVIQGCDTRDPKVVKVSSRTKLLALQINMCSKCFDFFYLKIVLFFFVLLTVMSSFHSTTHNRWIRRSKRCTFHFRFIIFTCGS